MSWVIGMDYWKRYARCLVCAAKAGQRCVVIRGGYLTEMTRSRAHPGRARRAPRSTSAGAA